MAGDDGDELGDRFTLGPLGVDTSDTTSHIDSHQKSRQCVPTSVDLDAIGALRSSVALAFDVYNTGTGRQWCGCRRH